jgi:hypothetical protein
MRRVHLNLQLLTQSFTTDCLPARRYLQECTCTYSSMRTIASGRCRSSPSSTAIWSILRAHSLMTLWQLSSDAILSLVTSLQHCTEKAQYSIRKLYSKYVNVETVCRILNYTSCDEQELLRLGGPRSLPPM